MVARRTSTVVWMNNVFDDHASIQPIAPGDGTISVLPPTIGTQNTQQWELIRLFWHPTLIPTLFDVNPRPH